MAVGGVAAEADVGDHHQLGDPFLELPHRLLDRALGGGGLGAGVVFPGGQPEEEDRGHPQVQGGFGLLHQKVRGQAGHAGHGRHFLAHPAARGREHGVDEVFGAQMRLPQHAPQGFTPSAGAGGEITVP